VIIADIAIRRPVFTSMVIAAIILFGLVSLRRIGTDLFPRVEFPVITVISILPGADPETVETSISNEIEEAVSSIAGIKNLRSVSADGVSQVIIEFNLDKGVDIAFQEVSARVASARDRLPRGMEEPLIEKFDIDSTPIMAVTISADLPIAELTKVADDVVKARLQTVRHVGQVKLVGGREREMRVIIDRERMTGHGVGIDDIVATLRGQSLDVPGGRVEAVDREWTVKTRAECRTADDFADLAVAWRDGSAVRLRDVASVLDDLEDERSLSRLDGSRAVCLLVRRQSGTNTLDVARAVERELDRLSVELAPRGIRLERAKELAPYIQHSIDEIAFHLVFGGLLAVLIVFIFLRDWRITLVAATAIPTSVVGAFILISAFGFTLNMMTMLALSLSIGILIDDAIVVAENIYRHYEAGMEPMRAASFGTAEIGLASMAITASVIAVFVPVAFMDGIIGSFFFQFGLTVAGAVALSLFTAFTLTPMMTSRMLHRHDASGWFHRAVERPLRAIEAAYGRLLALALRRRWPTLAVAAAALAAALGAAQYMRSEFRPQEDQSEFNVRVRMPLGAPIRATDAMLEQVRARIAGQPWYAYGFATIGSDELQRVNEGELYVKMTAKAGRTVSQLQAMDWTRRTLADIADATLSVEVVERVSGGGMKTSEMQVDLRGPDLAALGATAARVVERMRAAGGYVDIDLSWRVGKPELEVVPLRGAMNDLGVGADRLGESVRLLIGGDTATTFTDHGDRYDVTVRLAGAQHDAPGDLLDVPIRSRHGGLVPLRSVAQVSERSGPLQIDRYGRSRQITISANLVHVKADATTRTLALGEAKEEMKRFAAESGLPQGSSVAVIGMAEVMEESFANLLFALGMAVVMVYLVLASQFEHLLHPLTIMLSLPLALVGALGLLVLSGSTMSIFTMIGIIMLMGLVTKNAILLVDYTNVLRRRDGLERDDALRRAGPVRLRPILMTTLAMIAGMSPIALGTGAGAESRAPMAITVIGGLITSTLLTLVVVPVVYSILDDLSNRLRRRPQAG